MVKKLKIFCAIYKTKNWLPLDRGIDFSDSIRREHIQEDVFGCGIALYLLDERFKFSLPGLAAHVLQLGLDANLCRKVVQPKNIVVGMKASPFRSE